MVVLLPLVGFVVEAPASERLATSTALAWVTRTIAMALLTAALYYHWWVFRRAGSAWLCASSMTVTAFSLPVTLLALASPTDVATIARAERPGIAVAIVAIAVMLLIARRPSTDGRPLRPLRMGALAGAAAAGVSGVWWLLGAETSLWGGNTVGPALLVGASGLTAAWVLSRVSAPKWLRRPLVMVMLLCTTSSVLSQWAPGESAWRNGTALGIDILWTGLLALASLRLVMFSWSRQTVMREEQACRIAEAEEELRRDEEMLHELRTTLAGITSAARLLSLEQGPVDRNRLGHLSRSLAQELARVERLVNPDGSGRARMIDLAQTINPVVECARATGQSVRWRPARLAVYGRPDDIAEAMDTLLANARRHAPGSAVQIIPRQRSGHVELRVGDDGAGVQGDLQDRLFARGAHSEGSVGQGLGLYVARQRLAESGGDLSLAPSRPGEGAAFVLRLLVAPPRELVDRRGG